MRHCYKLRRENYSIYIYHFSQQTEDNGMALSTRRTPSETSETTTDSSDLFGPDKSFGYLIRDVHRAFVRDLVRALEPYNLSGAQWAALRVLWEEQGLTQ